MTNNSLRRRAIRIGFLLVVGSMGVSAHADEPSQASTPVAPAVFAIPGQGSMPEPLRIAAIAAGGLIPKEFHLWISRRYESGTTNRLSIDGFGRYWFFPFLGLETGLGVGAFGEPFSNFSLSLLGLQAVANFPGASSLLVLGWHFEQWPDWRTSEHRVVSYWLFNPVASFSIWFGLAYRIPSFAQMPGNVNSELQVVYRIDWEYWRPWLLDFGLGVWNIDQMRITTPNNLQASLWLGFRFWQSGWRMRFMATQGIKGVSGGVLSFGQNQLSLGVSYAL